MSLALGDTIALLERTPLALAATSSSISEADTQGESGAQGPPVQHLQQPVLDGASKRFVNADALLFSYADLVPTLPLSWGKLKIIYRN